MDKNTKATTKNNTGLNKEMLLGRQNQLLVMYQDLESMAEIPLNLDSVEGQSWVRSISFRIVQELGEAALDSGRPGEGAITIPPPEELVDALFYFLELVLLSNSQDVMLGWEQFLFVPETVSYHHTNWEEAYWACTIEIVELNQLLRKRPWRETGADLDKIGYDAILKRIYGSLCRIYVKRGLTPDIIEKIYLEKWRVNWDRAQVALLERERTVQTMMKATSPTLTLPDNPETQEKLKSFFASGPNSRKGEK